MRTPVDVTQILIILPLLLVADGLRCWKCMRRNIETAGETETSCEIAECMLGPVPDRMTVCNVGAAYNHNKLDVLGRSCGWIDTTKKTAPGCSSVSEGPRCSDRCDCTTDLCNTESLVAQYRASCPSKTCSSTSPEQLITAPSDPLYNHTVPCRAVSLTPTVPAPITPIKTPTTPSSNQETSKMLTDNSVVFRTQRVDVSTNRPGTKSQLTPTTGLNFLSTGSQLSQANGTQTTGHSPASKCRISSFLSAIPAVLCTYLLSLIK